jgi:hypothetical protein
MWSGREVQAWIDAHWPSDASRDAEVQRLRDALEDTAQTLAWLAFGECRGFATSLLSNREALDKARAALKEQQ